LPISKLFAAARGPRRDETSQPCFALEHGVLYGVRMMIAGIFLVPMRSSRMCACTAPWHLPSAVIDSRAASEVSLFVYLPVQYSLDKDTIQTQANKTSCPLACIRPNAPAPRTRLNSSLVPPAFNTDIRGAGISLGRNQNLARCLDRRVCSEGMKAVSAA
jgi:hypothetical protein